jgi:hypothetical protein
VAAASVLFAALVPLVPAAHATVADITCAGTETQTFSPGLLLTPQTATLTVHSIYNPCVSTGDSSITFGTTDFSVTRIFSCLNLASPSSGTMTFDWSTGTLAVSALCGPGVTELFGPTVRHAGVA